VLVEVIADRLRDPEDRILARSIFGTDDPRTIAAQVEAFVPGVTDCSAFIQSVGAVFVLDRGIVLKVHAFGTGMRDFASLADLTAVYAVQDALAKELPCARVLAPPRMFSPGRAAALMAFVDPGVQDDPHAPATCVALAETAVRIATRARELPAADALPVVRLPATLLPPPHNALFDHSAPGGEWIDARAARARAVLEAGERFAVMHADISCANVRVVGGRVAAIYDMDSVCWIDEARVIGSIAVHFTYAGDLPSAWPSRDEARAFVAAYEVARGRPFERAERARLDAAAIYAIAYTARCAHVLGDGNPGVMGAKLADAPDAYFD
jgi:hypothetical protein